MSNVERLGSTISIPIPRDEEGYVGRECPVTTCLGYFKVTPGTGVRGPAPCYCPYCGHIGEQNTFFTPDQIEYAKSVALRSITDAIHRDLKALEFDHKPQGSFGIGFSLKVTRSGQHPVRYYREKNLETSVVCDKCTLRFAIYGVFGWCPDCGEHNSLQILSKNLELAQKELSLSASVEGELAQYLVADALENVVSAFDGFGREICLRKGTEIRFQSLDSSRRRVREIFGFDFGQDLNDDMWATICRTFEKRHLLAHKMGVIDDEYVRKANDREAVAGRRVRVTQDEVSVAINVIETLGQRLFKELLAEK